MTGKVGRFCFDHYIGSFARRSVEIKYGKGQGAALVEPDEEAVELRATAHLRMAAKHSVAIFLWNRPANGCAKTGRTGTSCRANSEDQFCRRGVKGMQSLVWVPGRNVRRMSRARPRPVKGLETDT